MEELGSGGGGQHDVRACYHLGRQQPNLTGIIISNYRNPPDCSLLLRGWFTHHEQFLLLTDPLVGQRHGEGYLRTELGELGGQLYLAVRVRGVLQPNVTGRERYWGSHSTSQTGPASSSPTIVGCCQFASFVYRVAYLTRGGHAAVQPGRHPALVPAALRHLHFLVTPAIHIYFRSNTKIEIVLSDRRSQLLWEWAGQWTVGVGL